MNLSTLKKDVPIFGDDNLPPLQNLRRIKTAYNVIMPHAKKGVAILKKGNFLFNPNHERVGDIKKRRLIPGSIMYAMYNPQKRKRDEHTISDDTAEPPVVPTNNDSTPESPRKRRCLRKVGQTPNVDKRQYTVEEFNRIRTITKFNLLPKPLDDDIRSLTDTCIKELANCDALHPHQRLLFQLLDSGLSEFGMTKQIARLLCEAGANEMFGITDDVMELGGCDADAIEERLSRCKSAFKGVKPWLDELSSIAAKKNVEVETLALCSWRPDFDSCKLTDDQSSTIICTEYITKKWEDTIPFAAEPGVEGKMYSTLYKPVDLINGLKLLISFIVYGVTHPVHGIIDMNTLVSGGVRETLELVMNGGGAHPNFFKLVAIIFKEEVFVFFNATIGTVFQVHFSLCGFMNSAPYLLNISKEQMMRMLMRGMTVESSFSALLRNLPPIGCCCCFLPCSPPDNDEDADDEEFLLLFFPFADTDDCDCD